MKVEAVGQSEAARAATNLRPGGELGKDAFLKILLAQIKNQDPLKPTDSTAMVAQLAQFSTLEQLQNLNTTMEQILESQLLGDFSAVIGRVISYLGEDGEQKKGFAESLLWRGRQSLLRVNGELVPLNRLLEIGEGL
ncbi:MAG: Basal-body rod modification protein FlgD [Firmicutes bacterium]|nr:Basal-body rod modification protein FlgD [Bacillota bacterium]